jgi:hypothetical protein
VIPERLRGETAAFDIRIGDKVIVEKGKRITARHVRELEQAARSARWKCRTNTCSAASSRTTSSTRRPANCSRPPTTS